MAPETFASRLRQLREAAGLTQPQLAERAGMNQFGIAKLEQGVREPTWATVQALARALGVSCEAFQAEGEEPPAAEPTRPRGRPRKAEAPADDAAATPPPQDMPPVQRKPRGRKPPRPRGG